MEFSWVLVCMHGGINGKKGKIWAVLFFKRSSLLAVWFSSCTLTVVSCVISWWRAVQLTSCQHLKQGPTFALLVTHCMVTMGDKSSCCGSVGIVVLWIPSTMFLVEHRYICTLGQIQLLQGIVGIVELWELPRQHYSLRQQGPNKLLHISSP